MKTTLGILAASAIVAACGGGTTKQVATPTIVVASTPSPVPCATPPAGPVTLVTYQAPATSQLQNTLIGLQEATSACSDTATFTFSGPGLPAYEAKYEQAVTGCGSGLPISTLGNAQLTLRLEPAVAHDQNGNTTAPVSQTPGYASMKELKPSCDFEGVVAWVIGTEPRYYTVTTASSPPRIIVEVYH